jgi:hypothetical protein
MKPKVRVTHRTVTAEIARAELEALEGKHGITSTEFRRQFASGEFHDHDFVAWEFYCDMADELGVPLN